MSEDIDLRSNPATVLRKLVEAHGPLKPEFDRWLSEMESYCDEPADLKTGLILNCETALPD